MHILLGLVLRSRQQDELRTDSNSWEQLRTVRCDQGEGWPEQTEGSAGYSAMLVLCLTTGAGSFACNMGCDITTLGAVMSQESQGHFHWGLE